MHRFSITVLFVGAVLTGVSSEAADISGIYEWKPMKIGGGGWVVGMDIHPTEKNLRYVRTDVSGAYRWDAASSSWKQLVTAESLPADHVKYGTYRGVDSLVGAPGKPDIAYMAYNGQIFQSVNRGDNWTATSFGSHGIRMEPNSEGRQEGERLAVDPHDSRIVYFGSIADGLWMTEDAGANWKKVETVLPGISPHGVNTVVFDPNSGTCAMPDGSRRTKVIYVTVDRTGIFRSEDGGASWDNVAEGGPGTGNVRDAALGPDGTYYVVHDDVNDSPGSVWKRFADGRWRNITPPEEQGRSQSYGAVAVNPNDPRHLVVMRNGGWCFVSQDQGEIWSVHDFQLKSPEIQWLGKQENYWLSVGELSFDPNGELWFAEGFGVWRADDFTSDKIEWRAESSGIEETCGNDIICPPGGRPLAAAWDVGVFRFANPDACTAQRAFPWFMSAWALDWCPADPKFLAAVFRNHLSFEPHVNETGYSTDGGLTWKIFPAVEKKEIPKELEYGTIAVSAESPDHIVWAPARRMLPHFTKDRGVTWKPSTFGHGINATGFDALHSPQKPLCADRVLPDTFYFYHPGEGLFRSEDGGAAFIKISSNPPLNRWNAVLKAVPGHAGHLLFAEGHQGKPVGGLWHSADGGITWRMLPFLEQAFNFGLGKAKEPDGYPTLFAAGVANGETGIYRSADAGITWDKIGDYPLGVFDWIDAMDGDKDIFGKVYLAFASAGFAYGEEKK